MNIVKGLEKDVNPVSVPTGFHIDGRNMLIDKNASISNERGFDLKSELTTYNSIKPIVCGNIKTSFGITILFSYYVGADTHKIIEIGKYDGTTYTRILRDGGIRLPIFDWNVTAPITGTARKNNKGEIIITWRDALNPAGLLNITKMPFDLTVNDLIQIAPYDRRNLLSLFPDQIIPNITLESVDDTGGVIESGTLFFTTRYELEDGTATSWGSLSNPVMIIRDNLFQTDVTAIQGDEGGFTTGKSVTLNVTNIDPRFDFIRLGVVQRIKGNYVALSTIATPIRNNTSLLLNYSGTEPNEILELTEFTIDNISYDRIGTITELENRLHIGNLERTFEFDYQTYANNITSSWVYSQEISLDGTIGSFRDPKTIFDFRQFKSGEVYAFYIGFEYNDGTLSPAFHIPGRIKKANYETQRIADVANLAYFGGTADNKQQYLDIDSDAKFYQLVNDANNGGLAYWENENELYPNDVVKWGALANTPVRHHKLPTLEEIKTFKGEDLYLQNTGRNYFKALFNVSTDNYYVTESGVGRENFIFAMVKGVYSFANSSEGVGKFDTTNYPSDISKQVPLLSFNGGLFTPVTVSDYHNTFEFSRAGKYFIDVVGNFAVSRGGSYNVRYLLLHNANVISSDIDSRPNTPDDFVDGDTHIGAHPDGRYYGIDFFTKMVLDVKAGDKLTYIVFVEGTTGGGGFDIEDFNLAINITRQEPGAVNGTKITKALGLRFDNIVIPTEIASKVKSYKIYYAKRDFYNSTVVSQSYFQGEGGRELDRVTGFMRKIRYHAFDSLFNKYPNTGAYMKIEFGINNTKDVNSDGSAYLLPGFPNKIRKINRIEYAPEDNTAFKYPGINGAESNDGKEEMVHIELIENDLTNYPNYFKTFLGSICTYKKNMYLDFSNQPLVSTGKSFYITQAGTFNTGNLYGGDTYRVLQGVTLTNNVFNARSGVGRKSFYTFAETVDNVYYRYDDLKSSLGELSFFPRKNNSNVYLYNKDFSVVNDLNPSFPASNIPNITKFPYRVARGVINATEDNTLNWRLFRPLDYYEMRKDRGVITNLAAYGKQLIIHTEDSLFRTISQDRLTAGTVEINLGTGDIFAREPDELLPSDNGYAGTQSQVSAIITKLGYVFIDEKRGKIFILGAELSEISSLGMKDFFRDNLAKVTSVGYIEDSPYNDEGFVIGMDEFNNRILFTKRNSASKSFTLSYSIDIQKWMCYHDYLPEVMFNVVDKLHSYGMEGLYKHNSSLSKGTFYEGNLFESYIDIVFSQPNTLNKVFFTINWISEVVGSNGVSIHDDTVTKVFLYNSYQVSKETDLVRLKNLRKEDSKWNFNDFRDLLTPDARANKTPFLDVDNKLVSATIYQNTSSFNKRRFIDNYLVVRLYFDNLDNRALYLYDVEATWRIGQRSS